MTGRGDRVTGREVVGIRVPYGSASKSEFTYCVVDCSRTPGDRQGERRNDRRTRSHLREGFIADGKRSVAECRIRNLSKRGARLQLEKDRPLPKVFLLTEAGTRACYRATLVWQVGRDAGVRLVALGDSI